MKRAASISIRDEILDTVGEYFNRTGFEPTTVTIPLSRAGELGVVLAENGLPGVAQQVNDRWGTWKLFSTVFGMTAYLGPNAEIACGGGP